MERRGRPKKGVIVDPTKVIRVKEDLVNEIREREWDISEVVKEGIFARLNKPTIRNNVATK